MIAKALSWNETARKSSVGESLLTFENFFRIFWYSVFMYSQNFCYKNSGETHKFMPAILFLLGSRIISLVKEWIMMLIKNWSLDNAI